MGECLRARMCGTFARMLLMHANVKILSAVRSRPLIQVSFNGTYFSIIFWHFLFWNIIINVAKLSVCVQQKLAHKVMCHCAPSTGIVVCFALDPANLLLNTSRAHSMKRIKLTDIARPKSTTWSGYDETIRSLNLLLFISVLINRIVWKLARSLV